MHDDKEREEYFLNTIPMEVDDYRHLLPPLSLFYFRNDTPERVDRHDVFAVKHSTDEKFGCINIYRPNEEFAPYVWEAFWFHYKVGPYYRDMTLKCHSTYQDGVYGRPFGIILEAGIQPKIVQGVLDDERDWKRHLSTEEAEQVERSISRVYSSAQYKTITTRQWARAE